MWSSGSLGREPCCCWTPNTRAMAQTALLKGQKNPREDLFSWEILSEEGTALREMRFGPSLQQSPGGCHLQELEKLPGDVCEEDNVSQEDSHLAGAQESRNCSELGWFRGNSRVSASCNTKPAYK